MVSYLRLFLLNANFKCSSEVRTSSTVDYDAVGFWLKKKNTWNEKEMDCIREFLSFYCIVIFLYRQQKAYILPDCRELRILHSSGKIVRKLCICIYQFLL